MKSFTLLCMIRISVVIFDTQGFVENMKSGAATKKLSKFLLHDCCLFAMDVREILSISKNKC